MYVVRIYTYVLHTYNIIIGLFSLFFDTHRSYHRVCARLSICVLSIKIEFDIVLITRVISCERSIK